MRNRWWALVLACAAACVLALPAGGARKSYAWVYAGRSVQADPTSQFPFPAVLRLSSDGRAVELASFAERYTCPGAESFTDRVALTAMPIRSDGVFGKARTFPGGASVTISGRLEQFEGTFQVKATDGKCTAVTSYAVARGPKSYGGEATGEYPVSIELGRSRKTISNLSVFIDANCRDPQGRPVSYRAPSRVLNIALRGGSFLTTGSYTYAFRGSGAGVFVSYTLRGKVEGTTSTGSFGYVVSAGFPGGRRIFDNCSGSLEWTAVSR